MRKVAKIIDHSLPAVMSDVLTNMPARVFRALQEYVRGGKPRDILRRHKVSTHEFSNWRARAKVPSQLEVRKIVAELGERAKEDSQISPFLGAFRTPARSKYIKPEPKFPRKRKRGKYTERMLDEALAIVNPREGISAKVAAAMRGVGYNAVLRRARERGMVLPKGRVPRDEDERDERLIDRVIVKGWTLKEAGGAETPPITRERVRQLLKKRGYEVGFRASVMNRARENRVYHHREEGEILRLLRSNASPSSILRLYPDIRGYGYLLKLRHEHGIPKYDRAEDRPEEMKKLEQDAFHAYYNRPDLTTEWISLNILKSKFPNAVVRLLRRRGLPRTRGRGHRKGN